MVVTLDPELESAVKTLADRKGIAPDELALSVLRDYFGDRRPLELRDAWEHGLLAAARPWGVSHSDSALSSEGLYE